MLNRTVWRLLLIALCTFCGCRPEPRADDDAAGRPAGITLSPLESAREAKNAFFKSDKNSPIPAPERASFTGLQYFPPDPRLRFRVRIARFPQAEKVSLGTSTGEIRGALRYGYFQFEMPGGSQRLSVYRTMEDIESGGRNLFVPFRDGTSGKETYGAGRYLDFEENATGWYDLDFNQAYNPYCAYSPEYSCPLPPQENRLKVRIEAGEKSYGKKE